LAHERTPLKIRYGRNITIKESISGRINAIQGGSCKTLEGQEKSSFQASEARPGIQDLQAVLDSGLRRNDGVFDFCKRLKVNGYAVLAASPRAVRF
jgi:hypothetical protein